MLGKPVADFSLPSTGGSTFRLSEARGAKLVLHFHPKDNTSAEAARRPQGEEEVTRTEERSAASSAAPSWSLEKGVLVNEWRGVKVPGHVQEVLNFAKAL